MDGWQLPPLETDKPNPVVDPSPDWKLPPTPDPATAVNLRAAVSESADKAAQAKNLSQATGYPMPTVQRNLQDVANEQKVKDIQYQLARNPVLADHMRDPTFAAITHDDTGALGVVTDTLDLLKRGAMQLGMGATAGLGAQMFDISGVAYDTAGWAASPFPKFAQWLHEKAQGSQVQATRARASMDFFAGAKPGEGNVAQGFLSGMQSAGQNLALLPLSFERSLFTTTEQAATWLAGSMSVGVGAQAFTQAREKGKEFGPAMAYAVPHAAFEYLFEKMPATTLLKNIESKTGAVPFLWNMLKAEVPNEQLTTLAQNFNEWQNLNPEKPLSQFLSEIPDAAAQTLVATLVGVGVQTGAVKTVQHVLSRDDKAEETKTNADGLKQLLAAVAATKTLPRSPDTISQFVNSAAADGPIKDVYVDAATFAQAATQAGLDITATMPETAAGLQDALDTKSDVRIPLGELTAGISGTTLEQPIIEHLRTSEDGPTQREAADKTWADETKAQTEKILAEHEFSTAWKESADNVEHELLNQLTNAGRFAPAVNQAYAGFMAAFYATQAHRIGITPEEMYVKYPLEIRVEGASATFNQPNLREINVGLDIPGGGTITPEQVTAVLAKHGIEVTKHAVHKLSTENTFVANTSRAWTKEEGDAISAELQQEAVVQTDGTGGGEMFGPSAEQWGPFDPKEFVVMDGRRANSTAQHVATKYMRDAGFTYTPPQHETKVDVARAQRIADAYDAMLHAPADPAVAEAYAALIKEVTAQWHAIKATGLKVEFIKPGQADPYAKTPRLAIEDVDQNNHLWVFPTESGFGSAGEESKDNPLLAKTGEVIDGHEALANDLFRIVHDYFGHVKGDNGFRANGEENAWRSHAAMFSPLARRAMTTETRGQNSWVNYGPHGETNRTANAADTHYAPQKAGLLPEWVSEIGAGDVPEGSVSSRVPFAKGKSEMENPISDRLQIGLEAFKRAPKAFDAAVKLMTKYVNWRPSPNLRGPEARVEKFIDDAVDNLLWLYDQVPAHIRARSKLWYEGANHIANGFASKFGISLEQASAVIAVNSPQTEWFTNISRAERILDMWFTKQDQAWTPEMEATTARILSKEQYAADVLAITGKSLADLTDDPYRQAIWMRVYDESHNLKKVRIVSPEGALGEYKSASLAWAGFEHIAKSISVIKNGAIENVSAQLGQKHKVRSFYNNIFDPNDPVGDVTIDTHAVAAALLRPLSGKSIEVMQNFGAGVSNAMLGIQGTYGIYAEAYRRAAAERGVLPRELQSITWEAIRGMYTDVFKRSAGAEQVENVWQEYKAGKLDEAQVRAKISEIAGGIDEPNWHQSDDTAPTQTWDSSYGGKLVELQLRRQPARSGASGVTGRSGTGSGAGEASQLNQPGVLTPAQAKFVEGSAVTHVVHHGGDEHASFDMSKALDGAHFFTGNPAHAAHFGDVRDFLISIKNPLEITQDDLDAAWDVAHPDGEQDDRSLLPRDFVGDFVKRAKAEGHDGLIIRKMGDFDLQEDVYLPFTPEQIKSATDNNGAHDPADKNVYRQPAQAGARGNITIPNAGVRGNASIITLLARADLSTFLHESGHFYLEVLTDMASQPDAPQAVKDDLNKLLNWFGVAPARWASMTLEQKTVYHEKFARGFEAYLFEGKSPTAEMQPLFARFRAWMINVYKQLTALDVELTPEVRDVMNRLTATNDEIIGAEASRNMVPLFDSKPEGMTDDAWKIYQGLGFEPTQDAVDTLQTRSLRDMQWASGARSRALAALQKDAATKRAAVRAEVSNEVNNDPLYAAEQGLRRGWKQDDGSITYVRFNTRTLAEMYPENMVNRPDLSKLQGMTNAETGLHPDQVAGLVGFDSGDELIRKLTTLEPRQSVIDGLTDQRMLERYGDLADPAALAKAADEAVHNEARSKFVATELAMLSKAVGNRNVLMKAAKEYAAVIVGRQAISKIKPGQYAAAAARASKAAQRALQKNDIQTAAAEKRTELINLYATRAAYDVQKEIDKSKAFLKRVISGTAADVAKTRDVDVVMAARAILADYGIGKKGKTAQEYLKAVQAHDPSMYEVLRDRIDALALNAKDYTQLTVDEFRALNDEIGALWYLARRSRQMEVGGDLMDRQEIQDELRARMEEIGIPDTVPGEGKAVTDAERRLAKFQTLRAALRRVESWVGVKDGKAQMGPFRKYVWQQIKDAADTYRAAKGKQLKQYRALLEAVAPSLKAERIAAPELNYTFGHSRGGSGMAEILHAILHTGNASNKKKLLLGRQWAKENDDGSLDTSRWDAFVARMIAEGKITKAHYEFAQGVWNMFESTKALAQKTHRDVFGHYFAEITAEAFVTPFGTYSGGYVPALADPEVVTDAKTRALMEEENSSLAFAFPATNKGFTKGRVEYNRPLLLDLRVMSQHLDKVLLFSHMEQPVRDVRRVLTAKNVGYALNRIDPAAFDGLLTPWLNRTAKQQVESPVPGSGGLMRFFSVVRSRAGMAAMFANLSNTVQQITGISTAAVKVPPKYLLSSVADFLHHPKDFVSAVSESSTYMNNRMENEVGQMTDAINDILLNPSVYEKAQAWTNKHGYFLQSAVDNVLSPIIWTGAYNHALETLPKDLTDEQLKRQARQLADFAVRETQGAMLPEEVSRMETGNAFVRMFTQFAGYFNTQANMLGTEFAKVAQETGLKKGAGRAFYIMLFGMLVPAWGSEIIAQMFRGGPDDDDKDGEYLDDWIAAVFGFGTLRYVTAMLPGAGQVINAGVNTLNNKPYDDRISTAPAVSMIESAVKAPQSVYKAIVEDGKPGKAVKDVGTLISMLTGLPAFALARPISYLSDVASDHVDPTGPIDAARGTVTGAASPESKR